MIWPTSFATKDHCFLLNPIYPHYKRTWFIYIYIREYISVSHSKKPCVLGEVKQQKHLFCSVVVFGVLYSSTASTSNNSTLAWKNRTKRIGIYPIIFFALYIPRLLVSSLENETWNLRQNTVPFVSSSNVTVNKKISRYVG